MGAVEADDATFAASLRATGRHPQSLIPRTTVRQVPCRYCRALAGEQCTSVRRGERRARESNHMERVFDALRVTKT